MNLEALFDAVIVKPIEIEETMYGSIVVPDAGRDRNEHAEVVAVGPGKFTATGHFLETQVKVGDIVILPTMGFTKLEHEKEEYYVGPENNILARLKQ
jgi:chaperonin GroES